MTGLSKIDRFDVLEKIADGGFGAIHKGRDEAADRNVVIKLCTVEDQALRQRFFTEAEMACKLSHAHVVDVLAAGFHADTPYLVQEYLDGDDLAEVISQRLPWRGTDKLQVLLQVAQGMAYAHSQGISHLDLKPSNVRLGQGTAKIMDFGTSRLASSETRWTQRGVTLATACYMPPEQVRSGQLDHRVDVFAFGALAYELFTYQRPFRGQTLSALAYQILYKDPVPMASVWPECPAALDKLLSTCLAKDRELRYAGFPQLLTVLQRLHTEAAGGQHPALTAVVSALPSVDDSEDVMSQSMVTRTAASVAGEQVTSAAATQRVRVTDGTAPRVGAETVRRPPVPDPGGPRQGAVAPPGALPGASPGAAASGTASPGTASPGTASSVPPRPKIGATTRTSQPPEEAMAESAPPVVPAPPTPSRPTTAQGTPPRSTSTRRAEPSREGAVETRPTTRPAASATVPAVEPPPSPQPSVAAPSAGSPPAAESEEATIIKAPAQAPLTAQAPPAAADDQPTAGEKKISTGKLALSAQEIGALVAQGKLDEAQQHLQAMQTASETPEASELPTTTLSQAADEAVAAPNPQARPRKASAAVPAAPAASTPSGPAPPLAKTPSGKTAPAGTTPAKPPSAKPPSAKPPSAKPPSAKPPSAMPPPPPVASPSKASPPGAAPQAPQSASGKTSSAKSASGKTAAPQPASSKAPTGSPTATPTAATPTAATPTAATPTAATPITATPTAAPPTSVPSAPGQKTLDRSTPPAPSAPQRSKSKLPLLIAAGAVLSLALVGLAAWWFFGRSPEAPPAAATVPQPAPRAAAPATPDVVTGRVQVDASPWGHLTEITDDSGYLIELPPDASTPLALDLPEGTYNLVLSSGPEGSSDAAPPPADDGDAADEGAGDWGELQSCEVEVAVGTVAVCRVTFEQPSVTDYFKDMGWWQ